MSKNEHALAGLQLPELVIQRQGKSRYQVRCQLEEGTNLTIVGRVFADQEFGPISFRMDFVERFPQLKEVTIIRKDDGSLVYLKDTSAQPPCLDGRGRYLETGAKPQAAAPAQASAAAPAATDPATAPQATASSAQAQAAQTVAAQTSVATSAAAPQSAAAPAANMAAVLGRIWLKLDALRFSPEDKIKLMALAQEFCQADMDDAAIWKVFSEGPLSKLFLTHIDQNARVLCADLFCLIGAETQPSSVPAQVAATSPETAATPETAASPEPAPAEATEASVEVEASAEAVAPAEAPAEESAAAKLEAVLARYERQIDKLGFTPEDKAQLMELGRERCQADMSDDDIWQLLSEGPLSTLFMAQVDRQFLPPATDKDEQQLTDVLKRFEHQIDIFDFAPEDKAKLMELGHERCRVGMTDDDIWDILSKGPLSDLYLGQIDKQFEESCDDLFDSDQDDDFESEATPAQPDASAAETKVATTPATNTQTPAAQASKGKPTFTLVEPEPQPKDKVTAQAIAQLEQRAEKYRQKLQQEGNKPGMHLNGYERDSDPKVQADYYAAEIKKCPTISRNSTHLFTLDVEDFSDVPEEMALCGEPLQAPGEVGVPKRLLFLVDRERNKLLYMAPCEHSMLEPQAFMAEAQQVTNFMAQARGVSGAAIEHIKPLIAYDKLFHNLDAMQTVASAGFDCVMRLHFASDIGTAAMDYALSQGMHQGKHTIKIAKYEGMLDMMVPPKLCPTISTAQGEKKVSLHVFLLPSFLQADLAEQLRSASIKAPANLSRLSAKERSELSQQAFRRWAMVIATTDPYLKGQAVLDAFYEATAKREELDRLEHHELSYICFGRERSTFMGRLFSMQQTSQLMNEIPFMDQLMPFMGILNKALNKVMPDFQ